MGRRSALEDVDEEEQGSVFTVTKPKKKRYNAIGVVMLMVLAFSMFFIFLFTTFNFEHMQSKESAAASVAKGPFNGIVILRVGGKHPRMENQVLVGRPLGSDVKIWRKPGKFLQSPLKAVFNWENNPGKDMIPKGLQKVHWADVMEKNMNQKQKSLQMLKKDLNGGNSNTIKGKLVELEGGRNGILLQVIPGDGVKYHAASSDKKLKMKDDSEVMMFEDNNVEGVGHLFASGKILRLDKLIKTAVIDDEHKELYFDNKSDEYVDNSQKEKLDKLKEGIILKFNQNLRNFGPAEALGGDVRMENGAERTLERKYTTSGAEEESGADNNGLESEKELTAPEDGKGIYNIGKGKRRHKIIVDGKPEKAAKKKVKRKSKNKKHTI